MNEPLGLGLIGAGDFGAFCLQAYAAMPTVRVVAVADVDLARAQEVAPEDARVYQNYRKLLGDAGVQIVAINTPPFLHARMVCEAAKSGKHIFVEKPLAISMAEAEKAAETVRAAGVKLGINYVLRHHPLHRLAAAVLQEQALGKFQHWSLENFATDDNLHPDHWFWDRSRSGGIHVEHGVHFFDLCNYLVGAIPDEVWGGEQRRADGRVDRVWATARYGQEVLATFYHSFNQIGRLEKTTIRLHCTRGHIVIEGWIPTRLSLSGLVDEKGLAMLASRLEEQVQIQERFQGETAVFQHGGATEEVAAAVTATMVVPDRQQAYRDAIQAGMDDLVHTIWEDRLPQAGTADALLSLSVALAASARRKSPKINAL